MYFSLCSLIGILAFIVSVVNSQNLESNVRAYFQSETVKHFQSEWAKQKISFDNAILLAMQDIYGRTGMNVYIRKEQDVLKLSKGYYHMDNQVQLILADLTLDTVPLLWLPYLSLNLADNMIKIKSSLSKMIVNSNYVVFRNKSDIIYESKEQDPYKSSPFRYQQVENMGELAISIESCVLTGNVIATINGQSVNLGHSNFRLDNCRYTLEIYTPGTGAAPVIAKYNLNGDNLNMEHLLIKPLKNEFIPKLQAAMFSIMNSSSIFAKHTSEIRREQEYIFHLTSKRLNDVVRHMNKITIDRNLNVVQVDDFRIIWDDGFNGKQQNSNIQLTKMTLSGLETAYTAHNGGPYRDTSIALTEEIRFSTIQVKGNIVLESPAKANEVFALEVTDIAVNYVSDLSKNGDYRFEVTGWRAYEVVAPSMTFESIEAVVTGYLMKAIPKQIVRLLSQVFKEAMKLRDQETDGSKHNQEAEVEKEDVTFTDGPSEISEAEAEDQENGKKENNILSDQSDKETSSLAKEDQSFEAQDTGLYTDKQDKNELSDKPDKEFAKEDQSSEAQDTGLYTDKQDKNELSDKPDKEFGVESPNIEGEGIGSENGKSDDKESFEKAEKEFDLESPNTDLEDTGSKNTKDNEEESSGKADKEFAKEDKTDEDQDAISENENNDDKISNKPDKELSLLKAPVVDGKKNANVKLKTFFREKILKKKAGSSDSDSPDSDSPDSDSSKSGGGKGGSSRDSSDDSYSDSE